MINRTNYFFKYYTFCFLIISSLSYSQKKLSIVLDAGHGGSDHGANRNYSDLGYLAEKDVTLAVTLKLGNLLEKNKDFKIIYTRKYDEYPSLTERTNLANSSKADLFISIHCNGVSRSDPYGTETFVQGPDQNDTNLEVAKRENDVIFLDAQDRETFATYDPRSPESLIALKLQQSKYLEASLILGGYIEDNFSMRDKRLSRGVKQKNLHVLRLNAMPSVLVEIGFLSNYDEAHYLASQKGQNEVAESIYDAILKYKKAIDRKAGGNYASTPSKPKENPLKNDYRILLMSTPTKYNSADPALKGLKYVLTIKEGNLYKYYYATTNLASVRDSNLKTAKDAGFRNAVAIGFTPNQKLGSGYYTIEVAVTRDKLNNNSYVLKTLKDLERNKINGTYYYTFGKVNSLEDAVNLQKQLEDKGIKNTVIQKVLR